MCLIIVPIISSCNLTFTGWRWPNLSKSAEISQSYLNHSIDQFNQKSKVFMDQFLKLFHTKHEDFLADGGLFCHFCLALLRSVPSLLWSHANRNWPMYKANGLLPLMEICCINDEVIHQFFMKASLQARSPESSCLRVTWRMKQAEVIPNKQQGECLRLSTFTEWLIIKSEWGNAS